MGILVDLRPYQRFEQLTQGKVAYYEAGRGKPTLLLLHGMGLQTSSYTFQWIFKPLAKRHHVIAMDYLGFGDSDRVLKNGPTFDVIVDGIREFMDRQKIRKPVVIGHSAGGWFGGMLAYESPDRVGALIGIGSAGMNVATSAGVMAFAPTTPESARRSVNASIYGGSQMTPPGADEWGQALYRMGSKPGAYEGMKPLVEQMQNPDKRKSYLLQRRLPYITVPNMWVFGEVESMEPYPTWTREWGKIKGNPRKSSLPFVTPKGKYVMVKGATHNVQWEQPERIVKIIEDFVVKLP